MILGFKNGGRRARASVRCEINIINTNIYKYL